MKTEIVFKSERGTPITNSLLVAEKFGKRHDHVLRDVETLIGGLPKIEDTPLFFKTTYIHEQNGQTYPMYIMNRDGFSLLVMGFTGSKALEFKLEFIEAFNRMEKQMLTNGFQIPQTFSEALRLSAELAEKVESQEKIIEQQRPAVVFMNAVTGTKSDILMRDMAKLLSQNGVKIGEIRLYDWMTQHKYLIRNKRWSNSKQTYVNIYMPSQRASDLNIFFVSSQIITTGEHSFVKHTIKVTPKGQTYFINKFLKEKTA